MSRGSQEPEREERIAMEIVADAYDEWEKASGWHAYLEDMLMFPFPAKCRAERAISPLKVGDKVEVVDIGPADECSREMFVFIRWKETKLAIPLSQLAIDDRTDGKTAEAVNDWIYWTEQGYEF